MPRRRKPAGLENLVDLARKCKILERELSTQREAIERLTGRRAAPATPRLKPSLPDPYSGPAR